ncbi:SDR family oxidoreductase [Mycobacterium sp. PDNC021]|uniref:SDR family oxidoreductase n=1 Tax=Mycobacterium sp. PDNC021 TaxID=3391399 RepID=UPI003AABB144
MILVIGATGKIGGETSRLLTASGAPVRALVRNPAKAEGLSNMGAELVTGDLGDAASLDRAMTGVERVLLVSAQDLRQAELQGNAVEAAVRGGVGHIVKVSGIAPSISPGGPAEIGRQHWQTEHQIEQTGVPFTFLRPGFFMQNLLDTAAPMVARTGVLAAPMGSALIAMVDARDIAASAAAVLTGDDHYQRVYDITGPRAFAYDQLAAVLTDATGRPVRFIDTPPAMTELALRRQGHPDWYIHHLIEMARMFRAGAGAAVSTSVMTLTGRPPRSIEEFTLEHVEQFNQSDNSWLKHAAARVGIGAITRAASVVRAR